VVASGCSSHPERRSLQPKWPGNPDGDLHGADEVFDVAAVELMGCQALGSAMALKVVGERESTLRRASMAARSMPLGMGCGKVSVPCSG